MAGHHRLEAGTGPLLRTRPPHAGEGHRAGRHPGRRGAGRGRPPLRGRAHLRARHRRSVPRRSGEASARPLLRRGRARVRGLQAVRRLHGRLPLRGEEHPRPQLPVPGRGPRGPGVPRAGRGGRGRGGRPLPGHRRAPRGLGPQAAPHLHRRRTWCSPPGRCAPPACCCASRSGGASPTCPLAWATWCAPTPSRCSGPRPAGARWTTRAAWPSPRPSTPCPTPASNRCATRRGATSWG